MSKPQMSIRVPNNILDDIEAYQERHNINDRSEAARQVLRRGVKRDSAGETLGQQATGVAGVGTVVAAIAGLVGQPTAAALVVPFTAATFLFAVLWASIRVLEGRDLV